MPNAFSMGLEEPSSGLGMVLAQGAADPRLLALLSIIALSGFVFLFLQGRHSRAAQAQLLERSDELLDRVEALEMRIKRKQGERPEVKAQEESLQRIDALSQRFADMAGRLGALSRDLGRIEAGQSQLCASLEKGSVEPESGGERAPFDPTEIAEEYLRAEGYSRLEILREERVDGDIRILLRGSVGDEPRAGHLRLQNGRVIECDLSVPTSLFP